MELGSIFISLAILVIAAIFVTKPIFEHQGRAVTVEDRKLSELKAIRDRVILSLQELDMDYAMGKIPEADYQGQRNELMVAGAAALREIDELEGSETGVEGRDVDAERFARQRCAELQAVCVHAKRQAEPPASASLLTVEPSNVSVAAIKETEFESGALLIRVRENEGRPTEVTLRFGSMMRPVSAVRSNVLEEPREQLVVDGTAVRVPIPARSLVNVLVRVEC